MKIQNNTVAGRSPVRDLTPEEGHILERKGTERPFSGAYWNHFAEGEYRCRRCGTALYPSDAKFRSHCGWPSFDDAFPDNVRQVADVDGVRTEIVCAHCGGHLGHVFAGEGFTAKNIRHCVNSLSLDFASADAEPEKDLPAMDDKSGTPADGPDDSDAGTKPAQQRETAVFAGGCFWGVEHLFQQLPGVIEAVSGYTGGTMANPDYEAICTGRTGHAEAVRVVFDPSVASYDQLCRYFFEIHDPTQHDRQGPDMGTQYRSAVFYATAEQRQIAERLVAMLTAGGYDVATEIVPLGIFYEAEAYHQRYLERHPHRGCHIPVRRFDR